MLVLRICLEDGTEIDWEVDPQNVKFEDALEVLRLNAVDSAIAAFDYTDQDGDQITVRSDEEMQNMLELFLYLSHSQDNSGNIFMILPRKPNRLRNFQQLKIKTRSNPACEYLSGNFPRLSTVQEDVANSGSRTEHEERVSLSVGDIQDGDLQYKKVLGTGHSGTVYLARKTNASLVAVKVTALDIPVSDQRLIMQSADFPCCSFHRPGHGLGGEITGIIAWSMFTLPIFTTARICQVVRENFQELSILQRCRSQFIVNFYGVFFAESRLNTVIEFMDGGSLDRFGQVPEPVLAKVGVAVVRGLAYLSSLRVLHRDVKPSNFLVNSRGRVKLCDFGVSKQLTNSIFRTYIGTNAYMAPERILGDDYTVRSDIWSLGLSIFEMGLGRFPYPSLSGQSVVSPIDIINSIVQKPPPELPGHFSETLKELVHVCMSHEASQRPTPDQLLSLAFLRRADDSDLTTLVSLWIGSRFQADPTLDLSRDLVTV